MTLNKQRNHSPTQIKDGGGNTVDFQITAGEETAVDISAGFVPPTNIKGFYICPLTTGDIKVRLAGQTGTESFTIPTARVDVMNGLWMEEKCIEIIATGTTVTSALIGWSY